MSWQESTTAGSSPWGDREVLDAQRPVAPASSGVRLVLAAADFDDFAGSLL